MKRKFGWLPDLPDKRDKLYRPRVLRLPKSVDLRAGCSDVQDQGTLGSCTGNATASAIEFNDKTPDGRYSDRSRLFIYYQARALIGTVAEDSGAYIRDCIKSLAKYGVPDETAWPYDVRKFTSKPPKSAYTKAKKSIITSYERVADLNSMKNALARGYPVTFGFSVYDSFMSRRTSETGIVSMPSATDKLQGGHAVLAVGYDDSVGRITVKNSWGTTWGDKGFFYLPYAYITPALSDDYWVIYK